MKHMFAAWAAMALFTIYLVTFSDAPRVVVALVSWTGGCMSVDLLYTYMLRKKFGLDFRSRGISRIDKDIKKENES